MKLCAALLLLAFAPIFAGSEAVAASKPQTNHASSHARHHRHHTSKAKHRRHAARHHSTQQPQ